VGHRGVSVLVLVHSLIARTLLRASREGKHYQQRNAKRARQNTFHTHRHLVSHLNVKSTNGRMRV
jgi:diadenosine tetraphosphate (Ap4A) HIT family hydrolase